MKANRGVDVYIHIFLALKLAGGEWSASRPGLFSSRKRAPGTHWIGGWVGPRDGMKVVEKILYFTGTQTPTPWSPVASRYTDCAIPAPQGCLIDTPKALLKC
jgi:hypothetical protein